MKVEVFSLLREKLGWREKVVELPGDEASLRDVLEAAGLLELVASNGELAEGVIVLVNGQNVRLREGLEARVRDGDEVAVFPPGGGG